MRTHSGEHRPADRRVGRSAVHTTGQSGTGPRDYSAASHKGVTRQLLATASLVALMAGAAAPSAVADCATIITGTSAGCTNTGTLAGIRITNATVSGSVINNGTIGAGGIFVINSTVQAGISNGETGTITAGGFSSGIGLLVSTFSGGISNRGAITGIDDGIIIRAGDFSGGISNSGVITTTSRTGIFVSGTTFSGGISNSGTISAPQIGVSVRVSTFSGGISSSGAITSISRTGISVRGTTFSGGISNSGTISAARSGISVSVSTFSGGISNSGRITSGSTGIFVSASSYSGGVNNSGTIIVTGTSANGIAIKSSTFSGGISNSGTISGGSRAGVSVFATSAFTGGISNSGTISTVSTGISLSGVSTFAGGISNSGTITGVNYGIVVKRVSTFAGDISNGGTISATRSGILAFSPVAVTNTGTISGLSAASLLGGSSSLFNSGSLLGNVIFAGGNNVLTVAPTSVITGIVVAERTDTFQLGGSGIGSFDVSKISPTGQYQGFGTFNKVGDATWTLTGSNAQALPWTIQQGTLIVGGTLPNSPFTINGGVLGGNGTIGSLAANNGGTVAPGNLGTLSVNGDARFAAGSTYQVHTNANGQSDRIVASGKTTLTGGTVQVLAAYGNYAPSTRYTIVTSQGGISGAFTDVTSNFAFLTPTLSYDPNDVFLTLTRNAYFTSAAQTPNQRVVAAALDQSPLTSPLVTAVVFQTRAGATQAFDALSGEIHSSVKTSIIDDSRFVRQAMLGRLRQAAYSQQPGDLGALAFGGPELAYQDPRPLPVKATAPAAPAGPDVAYWTQAFGAWGRADGDGNAAGDRRDLAGFLTGVDARFGLFTRAGLAAGYTHASVDVGAGE
jgi:hypothetical protein